MFAVGREKSFSDIDGIGLQSMRGTWVSRRSLPRCGLTGSTSECTHLNPLASCRQTMWLAPTSMRKIGQDKLNDHCRHDRNGDGVITADEVDTV